MVMKGQKASEKVRARERLNKRLKITVKSTQRDRTGGGQNVHSHNSSQSPAHFKLGTLSSGK